MTAPFKVVTIDLHGSKLMPGRTGMNKSNNVFIRFGMDLHYCIPNKNDIMADYRQNETPLIYTACNDCLIVIDNS